MYGKIVFVKESWPFIELFHILFPIYLETSLIVSSVFCYLSIRSLRCHLITNKVLQFLLLGIWTITPYLRVGVC